MCVIALSEYFASNFYQSSLRVLVVNVPSIDCCMLLLTIFLSNAKLNGFQLLQELFLQENRSLISNNIS